LGGLKKRVSPKEVDLEDRKRRIKHMIYTSRIGIEKYPGVSGNPIIVNIKWYAYICVNVAHI
jgi:hypothetical protein